MSADIQQARDVLAKWAEGTTPRPWAVEEMPETGECRLVMADEDFDAPTIITVASGGMTRADAALIVGTAGNPALWDALDGAFAKALTVIELFPGGAVAAAFVPIAEAIIAADERMTS